MIDNPKKCLSGGRDANVILTEYQPWVGYQLVCKALRNDIDKWHLRSAADIDTANLVIIEKSIETMWEENLEDYVKKVASNVVITNKLMDKVKALEEENKHLLEKIRREGAPPASTSAAIVIGATATPHATTSAAIVTGATATPLATTSAAIVTAATATTATNIDVASTLQSRQSLSGVDTRSHPHMQPKQQQPRQEQPKQQQPRQEHFKQQAATQAETYEDNMPRRRQWSNDSTQGDMDDRSSKKLTKHDDPNRIGRDREVDGNVGRKRGREGVQEKRHKNVRKNDSDVSYHEKVSSVADKHFTKK